jgi:hypothetical protein
METLPSRGFDAWLAGIRYSVWGTGQSLPYASPLASAVAARGGRLVYMKEGV